MFKLFFKISMKNVLCDSQIDTSPTPTKKLYHSHSLREGKIPRNNCFKIILIKRFSHWMVVFDDFDYFGSQIDT